MSIFPKHTVQGKAVTIHWSVALESEPHRPLFPLVHLGVKSPNGEIRYLWKKNILLLPKDYQSAKEHEETLNIIPGKNNNLDRNIPILILADYLSGKRKKEQLIQILRRINTARHFYFTYTIADDAPLGKYELVSELYLDGTCYKSLTAEEDFFYVEKIKVKRTDEDTFKISNPSPEDCSVKIIDYSVKGAEVKLYNIPAKDSLTIRVKSSISYALYNEEKEVIPLKKEFGKRILRNQTLQSFEKNDGNSIKGYAMFPDNDDAYILEGTYLKIWQLADGTVEDNELKSVDADAFSSMLNAGLLYEI